MRFIIHTYLAEVIAHLDPAALNAREGSKGEVSAHYGSPVEKQPLDSVMEVGQKLYLV